MQSEYRVIFLGLDIAPRPYTIRLISSFLTATLFVWLLPLGIFIKPSQEKTACDGKRAFHMCSMMTPKTDNASDSKVKISSAGSFNENAKSSSSGGNDFIAAGVLRGVPNVSQRWFEANPSFFYPLISFPSEHVPK